MCEAAFTLLTNPPGSVLGEHFNSYHITEMSPCQHIEKAL